MVRRRSPRAVLHTDAVQAVPWLDVAAVTAPADLVAVSAHKFGGPKGVGALVVARRGPGCTPAVHGGGQERGRRSGTPNVAGASGMAAALAATDAGRPADVGHGSRALRDRLGRRPGHDGRRCRRDRAAGRPGGGDPAPARSPGSKARRWSCCSTRPGSPRRPGRPARAGRSSRAMCWALMGLARRRRRSGVRFSLGVTTTDDDVDRALEPSCPAPSPACETEAGARAGGHVRWGRLVGRRRARWPSGSGRDAGGRGHPQAVGRRRRTRAAARWPTSTTPAGWPTSSGSSTTSSTSPPTSRPTWSIPTSAATPRAARPIPASSATGTSSSTGCSTGPRVLGFDAVATGHHARRTSRHRRAAPAAPRGRPGQGPVLRPGHARPGPAGPHACSRSGELTKAEVRAEAAPARPAHRGQARQPGRLLHPLRRGPGGVPRRPGAAAPRAAGRPRDR